VHAPPAERLIQGHLRQPGRIGSVDGWGVVMRDLIRHTAGAADAPPPERPRSGGLARPRRALTGFAVAVVLAVVVVTAGCANSSTLSIAPSSASSTGHSSASSAAATSPASSPSGAVHFPATLFGMPHNTSAPAQQLLGQMTRGFAVFGTLFGHQQSALYGTGATSRLFVLVIAELSARAKKYGGKQSAAALRRSFLLMGATGVHVFPAGPGVHLACGRLTLGGLSSIFCIRFEKQKVGEAIFFGTSASNLSDAASKTNQAISASGG
jgi:hypothetical protein